MMTDTTLEISGIVTPAGWDTHGNVVAVSIATEEEREYLVDDPDSARELLPALRQRVTVRGHLKERNKKRTLQVSSFSIINGREQGGLHT